MSTPQSQLHQLSERIWDLWKMFHKQDADGYEESIVDRIEQIELQMQDLMCAQQRNENLLNVIIKLLAKSEV